MANPSDLTVVFRARSEVEASIVRGLLETHGIRVLIASDIPHAMFPLSISGLGEVRLSVHPDRASDAKRIIEDHLDELAGTRERGAQEFNAFETVLGYRFRDKGLLEHALTHRSRVHEDASGGVVDNESLEFLGDAVLGFIVSDRLFREFPAYDEGQQSKAKAMLVSASTLATLAQKLELGNHLLLGRGEEKTGGRQKPSLLADAFEAVIAAVYLDGGIAAAEAFIERQLRGSIEEVREGRKPRGGGTDHKSALQEWLHAHDARLAEYHLVGQQGPDHRKIFEVEVRLGGETTGRGEGSSKKEAEQKAAELALVSLQAAQKY